MNETGHPLFEARLSELMSGWAFATTRRRLFDWRVGAWWGMGSLGARDGWGNGTKRDERSVPWRGWRWSVLAPHDGKGQHGQALALCMGGEAPLTRRFGVSG